MVIVLVYNGDKLLNELELRSPLSEIIGTLIKCGYRISETYEGRRIVRMVAIDEPNNAYELFDLGGEK